MTIRDIIGELAPEALLLCEAEYDEAIMGIVDGWSGKQRTLRVVYDQQKLIELIAKRSDGDVEAAQEYFDFNIVDAYLGENMPLFFTKLEEEKCSRCGEARRMDDPGLSNSVCCWCGYWDVPPGPEREEARKRRAAMVTVVKETP